MSDSFNKNIQEPNVKLTRSSGVLLHISSLPGITGIGTLGKNTFEFIDFLSESYQKYWQILPTGPTGYGDSPYQTFSAFAGNPLLIDLEKLVSDGLLERSQIILPDHFDPHRVDYGPLINWKIPLLRTAYRNFHPDPHFDEFCLKEADWLEDFSLFMALKDRFQGDSWLNWDPRIKRRETVALERFTEELQLEINFHKFVQFIFFRQWQEVKSYANEKDISIIGDIPIFIAMDSSDAWANNEMFQFDDKLNPSAVAGVPPDFFSATGQLWGNPLYNWDNLQKSGFNWWKKRFKASLEIADLIRVDHFRGFAGYWSVPYGEKTAINGEWKNAPGIELFNSLMQEFEQLPVIAEDLGVITDDVIELRDKFDFPGMKILQFAFGTGRDNPFLPENYIENCVVYTGTHDNDTIKGWFQKLSDPVKMEVCNYLNCDGSEINWDLIRAAWRSKAALAVAPMQDFLGLDSTARINTPASMGSNWQWRSGKEDLTMDLARILRDITWEFER
jgi:4-alpha-glucanotransferase